MPAIIIYILKFSVSLGLVYLFYRLLLRRLTFYSYNRWYLLGYSLLCFIIPFINISSFVETDRPGHPSIIRLIPSIETYAGAIQNNAQNFAANTSTPWDKWDWILLIIATGAICLVARFCIQLFSFWKLKRRATLVTAEQMNLYHVNEDIIPFSFGNSVFINSQLHSETDLQEIIRHEFVHVKQRHTVDIVWSELLCMLNWYNPFAWLLKAAIRQNLEFIADNKVVKSGINKREYQYLLLKVIGNNQYSIAQKFNFSSLKKRIAMMNKLKTARIQLIRFLFVVPLLTVLLISFRSGQKSFNDRQQNFSVTNDTFNSEEIQRQVEEIKAFNNRHPEIEWLYSTEDKTKHIIFLKTGVIERYGYAGTPSMAALEEKYGTLPSIYKEPKLQHVAYLEQWQNISTQAAGQFHSENKNAKHIIFPGDSRVLVQLTNNYVETYDMDYDKDREQFEMTFGKLPDCVPSPSRSDDVIAEERSIVFQDTIPGLNEKGYFVYVTGNKNEATVMVKDRTGKLVESVPYKKWKSNEKFYTDKYGEWPAPPPPAEPPVPPAPPAPIEMPENVRKININNNKATVLLKDGKEEKYDLNKPEEKALFEKKYGEVIPPPAKPPVPPQPPRNADELVATQEVNRATIADEFEITDKKATMQLKDGTVEEYDLSKPADRKKFETKYGKIVTANGRIDGVVAPAKVIGSADGKTFVMPPIPRDRDVVWLNEDRAIIGGEEEILATITNRTTQQQLEDLIKQVKQKGVELKITNTDYDEGKLVSISGTVVSISGTSVLKDASGSFSASDFKKLILSVIKDGEHVYFKVRTTDNKTVI